MALLSGGSLSLPLSLCFLCLYPIYMASVVLLELFRWPQTPTSHPQNLPLHPIIPQSLGGKWGDHQDEEDEASWPYHPLLGEPDGLDFRTIRTDGTEYGEGSRDGSPTRPQLPQWMWTSHVAIYSGKGRNLNLRDAARPLWGWSGEEEEDQDFRTVRTDGTVKVLTDALVALVVLPRRLTIPSRLEENWSRFHAVGSAGFAPVLCYLVFFGWEGVGKSHLWGTLAVGTALSTLAFITTDDQGPPKAFPLPWVLGGFIMSVVWFYLIANELVSALVAVGVILGVDSSLLGLTVLAWGNSIGDTVSNLAMAAGGSKNSIQIAWSGCYAGPMFNALVGIGTSLVLASWRAYPSRFELPKDPSLYVTVGFLVVGLLFSLGVMLAKGMRFSRVQGIGLIGIYSSFLIIRALDVMGVNTGFF